MSTATKLVCKTCKVQIWIGQSGRLYSGIPGCMKALEEFLQNHRSSSSIAFAQHELLFTDDHNEEIIDYKEVDWNK